MGLVRGGCDGMEGAAGVVVQGGTGGFDGGGGADTFWELTAVLT